MSRKIEDLEYRIDKLELKNSEFDLKITEQQVIIDDQTKTIECLEEKLNDTEENTFRIFIETASAVSQKDVNPKFKIGQQTYQGIITGIQFILKKKISRSISLCSKKNECIQYKAAEKLFNPKNYTYIYTVFDDKSNKYVYYKESKLKAI